MAVHPEFREHSFDCLLHSLMNRKRRLANSALWPMEDMASDVAGLQQGMATEAHEGTGEPITATLAAMFARDGKPMPLFKSDELKVCKQRLGEHEYHL